jgi:hypothetical protein
MSDALASDKKTVYLYTARKTSLAPCTVVHAKSPATRNILHMEYWINTLPAACGICAGLLIGTDHPAQGILIALLGAATISALRLHRRTGQQSH